jgi:FAD/FMN-containing dehydrogenase
VPDLAADLAAAVPGVAGPGSPEVREAACVFHPPSRTVRPRAVVRPGRAEDVAATLVRAGEIGARVAVRSGGHAFDGFPVREDAVLLDMRAMAAVEPRPDGTVVVGPGARLRDVIRALAADSRAIPTGDCPTVGLGGLVTGGGYGYLTRHAGLTCDWLREATVVLADGRVVRCSEGAESRHLWACRGGGGCAGVVTEMVFETMVVDSVCDVALTFDWEAATEVVELFDETLRAAPHELDLKLKMRSTGPGRWVDTAGGGPPGHLPGTPHVAVTGQFAGPEGPAADAIAPLRASPALRSESLVARSYHDAVLREVPLAIVDDPAPEGLRVIRVASDFVAGRLGPGEAEALVDFVATLQSDPALGGGAVLLEPTDGAAATASGPSAYAHRDGRLLIQYELLHDLDPPPGLPAAHDRLLGRVREHLAGVVTGGRYVNYADRLDTPAGWWGAELGPLTDLVAEVDPRRTLISRLHPA